MVYYDITNNYYTVLPSSGKLAEKPLDETINASHLLLLFLKIWTLFGFRLVKMQYTAVMN